MNKIDKNAIGVLSLVEGMVKTIEKYTTAQTPLKYLEKIKAATVATIPMFPAPTKAECFQVARRIKTFETALIDNRAHFATTIMSMLIALVEEVIIQKAPQPGTVERLDALLGRLIALHKYWDRKSRSQQCYESAAKLADKWGQLC